MDTDSEPTVVTGAPVAGAPETTPPDEEATAGSTWIADGIVAKVAASAAREVDGVEDLRGGHPRRGWVRASERRRGGASVRVADGRASIDIRLVVRDGVAIPRVVDEVRARVIDRVEFATGMTVTTVDVGVVDVVPPPARVEPEPAAADADAVPVPAGPG